MIKLKFKKLQKDIIGIKAPALEGDAGYDLCASETVTIPAHSAASVHTQVAVELPQGY